ncbi:MAG: hypothetical protein V1794_03525 [Candidatus Glassbacteria bacterium]
MASGSDEKARLAQLLCESISKTLNQYAGQNPGSGLRVDDVREILTRIIDYLDIADITGFGPWKK